MACKIVKDNNPKIRKISEVVLLPLSDEDRNILNSMSEHLIQSQDEEYSKKHNIRAGVGLAAPQIGVLKRMFVVYYTNSNNELVHYQLVNPKIIESSIKKCALEGGEGCLSVDEEHKGLVHRYFKIVIKAFNALLNKEVTITARGYDAIVLQHEYDHLDGILFYDRINTSDPFGVMPDEVIL